MLMFARCKPHSPSCKKSVILRAARSGWCKERAEPGAWHGQVPSALPPLLLPSLAPLLGSHLASPPPPHRLTYQVGRAP